VNRFTLLGLVLLALVGPIPRHGAVSAQERQTSCPYDDCALRVVDGGGYFASQVVVRGQEGYSVALARRSDELEELFTANDSAAAYYARFESHDRHADWFGWVGTGLMLAGFVADVFGEGGLFSRSFLLYGGGLAVTYGVALPEQRKASTDLSNAVWWYNRSFVRPGSGPRR
jgi:hypothetical protein